MARHSSHRQKLHRALCIFLAMLIAVAPTASVVAQTNAAAMAVRQQAEGFRNAPPTEGPGSIPPGAPTGPPTAAQSVAAELNAGKLDTRYISPGAAIVIVARPSQLLASPVGQMLPGELVAPL